MNDTRDEFGSEEFLEDAMDETERKHDLEREIRVAADIRRDLEQTGPLAGYLRERRRLALGAMTVLIGIDPESAIEITQAQGIIREYLNVRDWIAENLTTGAQAKEILRDEFAEEAEDGATDVED